MVLLHGGAPRGAERIASAWADNRGVTQIVFKPDWTRHGKSAPFKRNDQLLDTLPIGLIVFPGSGITDILAAQEVEAGNGLRDGVAGCETEVPFPAVSYGGSVRQPPIVPV